MVVVSDGDRDVMRVSGGCVEGCARASNFGVARNLLGVSAIKLLHETAAMAPRGLAPTPQSGVKGRLSSYGSCVSRIVCVCDGRVDGLMK